MTEPISSVVRVAASPDQAKIFVAMLQAEGIPAHIDGDSLADEVAVSRRLMNLGGTRVVVPTASLERAREILDLSAVDADDLEAQAMAAEGPEVSRATPATTQLKTPWPLIGSAGLALLFLALWLGEVDARAGARNPLVRYEPTATGLREIRIADGVVLAELVDGGFDGHYEKVTLFAADGSVSESRDDDGDCRYESLLERRGGMEFDWRDDNRDGTHDVCAVRDAAGKKVQELRYSPSVGFVLQQY